MLDIPIVGNSVVLIANFGINYEGGRELFDVFGGPPVVLRKNREIDFVNWRF